MDGSARIMGRHDRVGNWGLRRDAARGAVGLRDAGVHVKKSYGSRENVATTLNPLMVASHTINVQQPDV